MNQPEHWRQILQRKIAEAKPEVQGPPRPLPKPQVRPKPKAGGVGRGLTEAEQVMYKRITGNSPRPGMTREEYNKVIARYRRGGGMS